MGSFRLRQGPPERRLAGISWRSILLGLVLGVGLLAAAPSAASAAADLSVTNTATPEPVLLGQDLTYVITVHNAGPDPATTANLSDELAVGLNFASARASQGTCSNTSLVMCDLGPIASGQDVTVTIVATVSPRTPSAVTNTASVYSPDDPNAPKDSNEVLTTVVPAADLMLTMTAVPDPVVAGKLLTYTLVVNNRGPSDATAVSVTDTLPAGVSFVEATTGCSETAGTVTCDVGTLPSAGSTTLAITVRPQSVGPATNQATVSSPVADPNVTDNSKSLDVTVSPVPPPAPESGGQPGEASRAQPLEVVLTESYVLISGRAVKLVKGKFVPVKLTCAGQRKCEGTITVTTARPVNGAKKKKKGRKQKRRIARLGSKKFSIEGNRQQKVLVPLSKSKAKLLRRLKRVKAKAAIREIDVKGNPRISTRTFVLRAR
jgi:uncharacterized repeat protein (TIGR01451 family)